MHMDMEYVCPYGWYGSRGGELAVLAGLTGCTYWPKNQGVCWMTGVP